MKSRNKKTGRYEKVLPEILAIEQICKLLNLFDSCTQERMLEFITSKFKPAA